MSSQKFTIKKLLKISVYINHISELYFKAPILLFLSSFAFFYPNYLFSFSFAKDFKTLLFIASNNRYFFFTLRYLKFLLFNYYLTDLITVLHYSATNVLNYLYYSVEDIFDLYVNFFLTNSTIYLHFLAKNVSGPSSDYIISFYAVKVTFHLFFTLIKLSSTTILAI